MCLHRGGYFQPTTLRAGDAQHSCELWFLMHHFCILFSSIYIPPTITVPNTIFWPSRWLFYLVFTWHLWATGLLTHEAEYMKFQQKSSVSFNQVKKKMGEGKCSSDTVPSRFHLSAFLPGRLSPLHKHKWSSSMGGNGDCIFFVILKLHGLLA